MAEFWHPTGQRQPGVRVHPPGDCPRAAAPFVGDAATLFAVAGGELWAVTFGGAP